VVRGHPVAMGAEPVAPSPQKYLKCSPPSLKRSASWAGSTKTKCLRRSASPAYECHSRCLEFRGRPRRCAGWVGQVSRASSASPSRKRRRCPDLILDNHVEEISSVAAVSDAKAVNVSVHEALGCRSLALELPSWAPFGNVKDLIFRSWGLEPVLQRLVAGSDTVPCDEAPLGILCSGACLSLTLVVDSELHEALCCLRSASDTVRGNACLAIANRCGSGCESAIECERRQHAAVAAGAFEGLVAVLRPGCGACDVHAVEHGCKAIAQLCRSTCSLGPPSVFAAERRRQAAADAGVLEALASVLSAFANNACVIEQACKALGQICHDPVRGGDLCSAAELRRQRAAGTGLIPALVALLRSRTFLSTRFAAVEALRALVGLDWVRHSIARAAGAEEAWL